MKKMSTLIAVACGLLLGACGTSEQKETKTDDASAADTRTTLVAYFSASNEHVTAQVAKTLAEIAEVAGNAQVALVREAIRPIPNARAELLHGLIADFAVEHGAHIIVRGVRNVSDHDSETQMAIINRSIRPELETMFLPASPEYQHFSSSMVRDMILYGRPLELYLPKEILPMVRQFIQDKER